MGALELRGFLFVLLDEGFSLTTPYSELNLAIKEQFGLGPIFANISND